LLFIFLFQGLNAFSNFWLTFWTEDKVIKNQSLVMTQEYTDRKHYYLIIYTLLGVLQGMIQNVIIIYLHVSIFILCNAFWKT
jgi:hypothetical protein